MTVAEKIGLRYRAMTENEKKIYNLMVEDVKKFSLRPIGEIAEQLTISKTTLVRFARNCGFKGYADFKKALQAEILLDVSPARKVRKLISEGTAMSTEEIRLTEVENINETFAAMDEKSADRLVDLIVAGPPIFTMSCGTSRHMADLFTQRMKIMGLRATTLQRENNTLPEEATRLREGDLLVVFEFPPYAEEVLHAVEIATRRGVTVAVVTDKPICPLAALTDLVFFCATDTRFFGNSFVAPLFWINMVTSQAMFRLKDSVMDTLEEQQKIFKDPRYYIQ